MLGLALGMGSYGYGSYGYGGYGGGASYLPVPVHPGGAGGVGQGGFCKYLFFIAGLNKLAKTAILFCSLMLNVNNYYSV